MHLRLRGHRTNIDHTCMSILIIGLNKCCDIYLIHAVCWVFQITSEFTKETKETVNLIYAHFCLVNVFATLKTDVILTEEKQKVSNKIYV